MNTKRFEWQSVASKTASGMTCSYLVAEEQASEVVFEHYSIEDVIALKQTLENIIRYHELRKTHYNGQSEQK